MLNFIFGFLFIACVLLFINNIVVNLHDTAVDGMIIDENEYRNKQNTMLVFRLILVAIASISFGIIIC